MESILKPAKKLIEILNQTQESGVIDLSSLNFSYPIIILPLATLATEGKISYKLPKNISCSEYFQYFNFPDGFKEYKTAQSYIPIYKFAASKANDKMIADKSEILRNLINLCLDKLGSPKGSADALNISVDEIISNIEDHSEAKIGWINAQFYPTKKYLEMCIVDRGITISGKYKKVGKDFGDDQNALRCALMGESSKPEKIRGSGLPTFTKMITQGFQGEMIIISGNAIAYANKTENPLIQKLSLSWGGTIVAFRIPKNLKDINYISYID